MNSALYVSKFTHHSGKDSGWGVKNAHYLTFYRYISIDTYFTLVSMHEEVKTMYFYTNIMQDSRIFGVFQLKLPGQCNFDRSTHTLELLNLVKNTCEVLKYFSIRYLMGGGIITLSDSRADISFWSSILKISLCGSISRYMHRLQQWLNEANNDQCLILVCHLGRKGIETIPKRLLT